VSKIAHVKAKVTRRFQAPADRVFDAWLDPGFATRWLFTSPNCDEKSRVCEIDPRIGGKYLIVDKRNGVDYIGEGEYLEIDRPRRLVFTFRMAQFSETVDRIVIEIMPLDKGCQLTLTQEITLPHKVDMPANQVRQMLESYKINTENGWDEMFNLLVELVRF
jgi:uncharacterized protein YndB with AHSA1/START domain